MTTFVITGATRGIGLAVAERLAQQCRVSDSLVLTCRDSSQGERVRAGLLQRGPAQVRLVVGDLGSVRSIRSLAQALVDVASRIDVLIHNAGLWPARLQRSEDGLEQAFVVNHLAPFMLNRLLAPHLQSGGRVVQVSAGLYVKGRPDLSRTPTGQDFHPLRTYATTKLCNLLLLSRHSAQFAPLGVSINALHPGVIRTGLGDRPGALGAGLKLVKRLWKEPAAAAGPVARLAVDPALVGQTGRYFHVETEQPLSAAARDEALAGALWQQAEQLTMA